jgi:hypothetical protein
MNKIYGIISSSSRFRREASEVRVDLTLIDCKTNRWIDLYMHICRMIYRERERTRYTHTHTNTDT